MDNASNSDSDSVKNVDGQVVGATIYATVLFVASLYIFLVTLLYERKVVQANNEIRNGVLKRSRRAGRDGLRRNQPADVMRYLLITAATFSLVRQSLEFVELRYAFEDDDVCRILRIIKNLLFAFCVTPVYLVLWVRQRMFYSSPTLEHLTTPAVRVFSASVVVIMTLGDVTGITLFLATRAYKSSPRGCIVEYSTIPKKLPGAFLFACTASFQIILLGLFLHPVLKHRKVAKEVSADFSKQMALMKRVGLMALVTVLSDGTGALISIIVSQHIISIFRQLIYDLMLLVGLVCVVGSFADWRVRLLPFLPGSAEVEGTIKRKNTGRSSSTELTTVS